MQWMRRDEAVCELVDGGAMEYLDDHGRMNFRRKSVLVNTVAFLGVQCMKSLALSHLGSTFGHGMQWEGNLDRTDAMTFFVI
jgi:hypothetical protein